MIRERVWSAALSLGRRWTAGMPPEKRYRMARRMGELVSRLFPAKRAAVAENLAVIRASGGIAASPSDVFRNFGLMLVDFVSDAMPDVRVEGREKADAALARGKGLLLLTSHLGNWELGGKVLARWGWDATAVYQPYASAAMRDFIEARRARGLHYLPVGKGAAAGVGQALKRGGAVAILGDRPFGEAGEPVTLCGRPARLPRGPFLFSARHGAPVVPCFVLIEAPGRYRVVVEEALWPAGKGPDAVKDLLDRTARILENHIRRHADQWFCFEPAWGPPAPGV